MIQVKKDLGVQIRRAREGRQLSQKACAEKAGISQQAWAAVEGGAEPNPKLQTLLSVCNAVKLSVEDVFLATR